MTPLGRAGGSHVTMSIVDEPTGDMTRTSLTMEGTVEENITMR